MPRLFYVRNFQAGLSKKKLCATLWLEEYKEAIRLKKTLEIIKSDIEKYWKGILYAAIVYIIMKLIFGGVCINVAITGFPCPGCGMTRGAIYMFSGQFARAFEINPAIYLWVGMIAYFLVCRYILHRRPPAMKGIFGTVLVLTILIFVYRMICYFPDRPPLSYTRGRVLEKIIPGYYEFVSRFW